MKGIKGVIKNSVDVRTKQWQELQYGLFIHWGLYSKLGGEWQGKQVTKGYSEQIQMWANIDQASYAEVAESFTAEQFNAAEICQLAKDAGMNYIVFTTKHHDGFSLFDTNTTDYNIVQKTPFGKDALQLLAKECEKHGLKLGLYFSLIDWHAGHAFDVDNQNPIPTSMEPLIEKQLTELMTNYGDIVEVWFDMSSPTKAQSKKFAEIVHTYQPNAMVSGRIWHNVGDFRTLGDNQIPTDIIEGPWQTPASIYRATWGYRNWQARTDFEGKVHDLLTGFISVVSKGGNYLLNIGPQGDGSIVSFEKQVLEEMGAWLKRHPKAVLGASGTKFETQSWGEITIHHYALYCHIFDWPTSGELVLDGLLTEVVRVVEDGTNDELHFEQQSSKFVVQLPTNCKESLIPVLKVELARELRMMPRYHVMHKSGQVISGDEMERHFNYADEGNYLSLKKTVIRQSLYIMSEKPVEVLFTITGKVIDKARTYQVTVGDKMLLVTGDELVDSAVGPFSIEENEYMKLEITLQEPKFSSEDIGLEIEQIAVQVV